MRKTDSPQRIRIEVAKLEAARRIGQETGLFDAPRVLEVDIAAGLLVMERISGLVGIRRVRASRQAFTALVGRAGTALGEIHRRMEPDVAKHDLPPPLGGTWSDIVPIHGDYSGENVCVSGDRLVVIDWQITPKVPHLATHGPAAFDVCWFLGNLFRRPVHRLLRPHEVEEAAHSFLDGYRRVRPLDSTELGRYLSLLRRHRQHVWEAGQSPIKRILLARGYTIWQQFAESIDKNEGKAHA